MSAAFDQVSLFLEQGYIDVSDGGKLDIYKVMKDYVDNQKDFPDSVRSEVLRWLEAECGAGGQHPGGADAGCGRQSPQ